MNKVSRVLTMSGMAVAAGLTFGAGPASAASASPAPVWGHSHVVGYYSNPGACQRAGHIGEMRGRWDDHSCSRVRVGFHRNKWVLSVRTDRHHGHGHFPHHH